MMPVMKLVLLVPVIIKIELAVTTQMLVLVLILGLAFATMDFTTMLQATS